MAKKSTTPDRRAVVEQMRKQQRSAERRSSLAIVGVCSFIALLIVGTALYNTSLPVVGKDWWDQREFNNLNLAEIGGPASACGKVTTKSAEGQNDHRDTAEQITYDTAPPAFGPHWSAAGIAPADMERKFYTAEDRPELESLVHNLEHGYTILWYDETAAADEQTVDTIRALARKFAGTDNFRNKFIAAPWTSEDGGSFPDGQHIALTHWSAGGEENVSDTSKHVGVWQYCSEPSGAALEDFMTKYPYTDSPEPNAM